MVEEDVIVLFPVPIQQYLSNSQDHFGIMKYIMEFNGKHMHRTAETSPLSLSPSSSGLGTRLDAISLQSPKIFSGAFKI